MNKTSSWILLIIALFLMSCDEPMIEEPIMVPPVVELAGTLDGAAYENSFTGNVEENVFRFGFQFLDESIECNAVTFKIFNVPKTLGTYNLMKSTWQFDSEPESYGYIGCGDLILCQYDLGESQENTIEVTEIDDQWIKGVFSSTYFLHPDFGNEFELSYEFTNVSFALENKE